MIDVTEQEQKVFESLIGKLENKSYENLEIDKNLIKSKLADAMEFLIQSIEVENPNKSTTRIRLSDLPKFKHEAVDYLSLNLDEELIAIDGKSVEAPLKELFEGYINSLPDAPVEE